MELKALNLKIDSAIYTHLDNASKQNGQSKKHIVEAALKAYLNDENVDDVESTLHQETSMQNNIDDTTSPLEARLEALEARLDEKLADILTAANSIEHGESVAQENRKDIADINHHLDEIIQDQSDQNHRIRKLENSTPSTNSTPTDTDTDSTPNTDSTPTDTDTDSTPSTDSTDSTNNETQKPDSEGDSGSTVTLTAMGERIEGITRNTIGKCLKGTASKKSMKIYQEKIAPYWEWDESKRRFFRKSN